MKSNQCRVKECKFFPTYNFPDKNQGVLCYIHKKDSMISFYQKRCAEKNCEIRPVFNFIGEKRGIYCSFHKLPDMINVVSQRCIEDQCIRLPSYNFPGEIKLLYCSIHKKENMINIISPKCLENECITIPNFNYCSESKGVYCMKHKKEGMINITKKCSFDNCNKIPTCNYPDKKQRLYCSTHKLEGMTNVAIKKCVSENCLKIPLFNFFDQSKGLYCLQHKEEGMIDVRHKKSKSNDQVTENKLIQPKLQLSQIIDTSKVEQEECQQNSISAQQKPLQFIEKSSKKQIIVHEKPLINELESGIQKKRRKKTILKVNEEDEDFKLIQSQLKEEHNSKDHQNIDFQDQRPRQTSDQTVKLSDIKAQPLSPQGIPKQTNENNLFHPNILQHQLLNRFMNPFLAGNQMNFQTTQFNNRLPINPAFIMNSRFINPYDRQQMQWSINPLLQNILQYQSFMNQRNQQKQDQSNQQK